jgi:hypothetical protein
MKIAVSIYGQPRNFETGYEYLSKSLKEYDVDYFIHSWFDQSEVGKNLIIYSDKKGVVSDAIKEGTREKILKLYRPKDYIIEKQIEFPEIPELLNNHGRPPDATIPTNIFQSMLYSRKTSIDLMYHYPVNYDICIATRTDVATTKNFIPDIIDDSIYSGYCRGDIWHKEALTCGIIASTQENIHHYGKLYDEYMNIYDSGVSYCAHRMAFEHMKKLEKRFKFILKDDWYWVRKNGLVPAFY